MVLCNQTHTVLLSGWSCQREQCIAVDGTTTYPRCPQIHGSSRIVAAPKSGRFEFLRFGNATGDIFLKDICLCDVHCRFWLGTTERRKTERSLPDDWHECQIANLGLQQLDDILHELFSRIHMHRNRSMPVTSTTSLEPSDNRLRCHHLVSVGSSTASQDVFSSDVGCAYSSMSSGKASGSLDCRESLSSLTTNASSDAMDFTCSSA